MGKLILITGGVRSGKSAWTLAEGNRLSAPRKFFIATAEPIDDEMRIRIVAHRKARNASWQTIEAPIQLGDSIRTLTPESIAIIDCCTVWLGNIWHHSKGNTDSLDKAVKGLLEAFDWWKRRDMGTIFVVTNEVGWGIVPHDAGIRCYRDVIGVMNQRIASMANNVYLCVSGIAVCIKNQQNGDDV